MKTTKELKIWSLRMVLFTILLSGLSVQKVYSFCNSTEIIMHIPEHTRSHSGSL